MTEASQNIVNYYQILNIPMNASTADIQNAMRKWMQTAPRNDETLAFLNGCKTHLLNPQAHQQYNRELLLAHPELLDAVIQQQPTTPPATPKRKKTASTPAKQGEEKRGCADFFALIGAGIFLSVIFISCSGKGSSSSNQANLFNEFGAQVACEDTIKDRLKAPATANFSNWERTPNGDGSFTVKGTVDSQNSFGANLRSKFSCRVRDKGNGVAGVTVEYLQ